MRVVMENISHRIAKLRREYRSQPFDESMVDSDPFRQFNCWFHEVIEARQIDPEAMTLSTVSAEGRVSGRIVLLKGYDERGFVFFTNYHSRKSRDLSANAWAALTFYWSTLNRQVRVEGRVEKVTRVESVDYFATRPRDSQLSAWTSTQSEMITSRAELEGRMLRLEEEYSGRSIPCPPHWGGFRVRPVSIEFWQGRESRLHDRICYTHDECGNWQLSRLAP